MNHVILGKTQPGLGLVAAFAKELSEPRGMRSLSLAFGD